MKTAVIITGEMRSFDRCLPTLRHHVLRHFDDMAFFVATVADANASKANLLREIFPAAQVEVTACLEQPDCVAEMKAAGVKFPKEWEPGKILTHEPYAISVHPQAILRQLWQNREGWRLFREKANMGDFVRVIRVRPDLYWHHFNAGSGIWWMQDAGVHSPWWGKFGGINDRFAIMETPAAQEYFETYSNVPQLVTAGCPIHPESLIAAATRSYRHSPLDAWFSTMRENGEMRAPEATTHELASICFPR